MRHCYRLNCHQTVCAAGTSLTGVHAEPTSPALPVYLKPSRSGRRKPSFLITRMREAPPSYAYEAPPLGTATPLFRITAPSCEYYALRLPLVKAGFRRLPSPAGGVIPCNVIWGRSMPLRPTLPSPATPHTEVCEAGLELTYPTRNPNGGEEFLRTTRMVSAHQRFNHFPLSHNHLGCKWGMTRRLRHTAEGLAAGGDKEERYAFHPRTWLYPDEKEALGKAFIDASPTRRFIWKPARGSCGRGIFTCFGGAAHAPVWRRIQDEIDRRVTNPYVDANTHPSVNASTAHVDRRYVVQEYIENPFLLHERKTDFRLYVAVTSYDPLTVYWHEEGLVRLAAQPYSDGMHLGFNRFSDLTNYSIGRRWGVRQATGTPEELDEALRITDEQVPDLKKSLQDFWKVLDARQSPTRPSVSGRVRAEMARIIVKTLLAVKAPLASATQRLSFPGGFFELYGFDIMLDAELRPWLIEVNTLPSLASTSTLDYTVKTNVVSDLLNLAMIEPFERPPWLLGDVELLNPLSREAQQIVNRWDAEKGKPLDDREKREEIRLRLQDELAYSRGFRRIFPPLPSENDTSVRALMDDVSALANHIRFSQVDEWALEG